MRRLVKKKKQQLIIINSHEMRFADLESATLLAVVFLQQWCQRRDVVVRDVIIQRFVVSRGGCNCGGHVLQVVSNQTIRLGRHAGGGAHRRIAGGYENGGGHRGFLAHQPVRGDFAFALRTQKISRV